MAELATVGVGIRYAERGLNFPFRGWWEARVTSSGTASGGQNNLDIVPNAPQNRVFRVDFIFVFWLGLAGGDDSRLTIGLSAANINGQIANVDMSGQAEGSQEVLVPNGFMWRANDPEQFLLNLNCQNINGNECHLVAGGVFYEAKA